jgi:hypothetical protein
VRSTKAAVPTPLIVSVIGGIVLCRGAADAAVANAMVNAMARRIVILIGSL